MKWCLVGVPLVAARVAALVVALVVARESCSALATGGAQASSQAAQPSVEERVQRVIDYAQAYRANLPSLECDEAMLSQRVRDGKVRQEVRIKATLREIRDESERGGFRDEYTYNMVNGRQRRGKAALAPVKTPYFVHNVFANSLSIGARPLPACYDYRFDTLDSGRTVQFTVDVKPAARDAACRGAQRFDPLCGGESGDSRGGHRLRAGEAGRGHVLAAGAVRSQRSNRRWADDCDLFQLPSLYGRGQDSALIACLDRLP
jgi:hypothetical protein